MAQTGAANNRSEGGYEPIRLSVTHRLSLPWLKRTYRLLHVTDVHIATAYPDEPEDFLREAELRGGSYFPPEGGYSAATRFPLFFRKARELGAELGAEEKPDFDPVRRGIRRARGLAYEERKTLVERIPDYGEIVCFCEDVTKAEVLEAIRRGAVTVDGVKRRVGTGMGRCQGARCEQTVAALLSRMLGVPESAVMKDGPGSVIVRAGHENL